MSIKNKKPFGQLGNAIVEFALIAPFLILVTLGTIELGRFAYYGILVSNAAQAGAAYGSQNMVTADDSSGMASAVAQDASPDPGITASPKPGPEWGCWNTTSGAFATPFPVSTSSTSNSPACSAGATPVPFVQVTAQTTVKPLFNLPFAKNTITISRTVVRRVQCQLGGAASC